MTLITKFFNLLKRIFTPYIIIELLFLFFIIGSIMVKCFYFQFTTRINFRPYSMMSNINMLVASLGFLLILISFITLFFHKKRKTALLFFNIILSLLMLADTVYFRYYYNVITVPVLFQIGLAGAIGESVSSLLKIKDIIYLIDIPVIILSMILLLKYKKIEVPKFSFAKRAIITVIVLTIGLSTFQVVNSKVDKGLFPYDNNYIIHKLGIFHFHYFDAKRFVKENYLEDRKLSYEEKTMVEDFFKNKAITGTQYKEIAKGKNIIIIQVEALMEFVINKKICEKEITPNLNKLINESLYFNNFYHQVAGGNTSDAEFLCNNSLYPMREGAVYFRFPTNTYYSLPKALKSHGYDTYVFHANRPSFWNRTEMYKAVGFDRFISSKNYELDKIIGWGLADTSFLDQSIDKIDITKPFYGFLITLSNHHPFITFKDFDILDVGELYGTFLGNYLKGACYADYAIGKMMDKLKTLGLYKDSLILIYGDHSASIPSNQSDNLKKFFDFDYNALGQTELYKVPLIIKLPGQENEQIINTVGGQIDLFPTIANLIGVDAPYSMGKDLLNTEKGYAVFRNGTVVTDEYVFSSGSTKVYDKSGDILDTNKYLDEIKSYQQELIISDIIIKKNAFK